MAFVKNGEKLTSSSQDEEDDVKESIKEEEGEDKTRKIALKLLQ